MPAPDVTVVIPTYQRWTRIGPTLRCALEQEDVDLEIVIVSDGEQRMPAGLLPSGEDRVRVIYPPEPKGVAHARNLGIQAAAGPWVAFLDDDDLWAPDKLARQLETAQAHDAGWAFTSALAVDDAMRPLELFSAPPPDGLLRAMFEFQLIPAGCSNVVVRSDIIRSAGGFDESLHQLCDWDLWIRLAAVARAAAVDDVLVAYVQHPGSMLLTHRDWVFAEFNRFRRKSRALGRSVGGQVNAEGYSYWVSGRLEDAGLPWRAAKASLYAAVRYAEPALAINALRIAARLPRRPGSSERLPAALPAWMLEYVTT